MPPIWLKKSCYRTMTKFYSLNLFGICSLTHTHTLIGHVNAQRHFFSTNQFATLLTECLTANQILTECCMSMIENFQYMRTSLRTFMHTSNDLYPFARPTGVWEDINVVCTWFIDWQWFAISHVFLCLSGIIEPPITVISARNEIFYDYRIRHLARVVWILDHTPI